MITLLIIILNYITIFRFLLTKIISEIKTKIKTSAMKFKSVQEVLKSL